MKKNFVVLLLTLVAALFLFSNALCKGTLGDHDGYSTYIGKTRSEVRRLSPIFEEFEDNMYLVDYVGENDEFLGLVVVFDEYNLVQSVMVIVTDKALKILISDMPVEPDVEIAGTFGVITLGFPSDGIIRSELDDEGKYIIYVKGGIIIVTSKLNDYMYATMTMQK